MELARHHPYAAAGVALAATSLIATTPVAPPPLDLRERAVQLTASSADDLAGLTGELGQGLNTIIGGEGVSSVLNGGLSNVGDLPNPAAIADPGSGLGAIGTALQEVISLGLSQISTGAADLGAGEVPAGLDAFIAAAQNFVIAAPDDLFVGLVEAIAGQPFNGVLDFGPVPLAPDLAQLTANVQEFTQAGLTYTSTGLGELAQGSVSEGLVAILNGLDFILGGVPTELFIDSLSVLAATLIP